MYTYNIDIIPDIINYCYVTNSNVHNYNTRNGNKISSAFSRHKYMYRNFRFISVHIWNLVFSLSTLKSSLRHLLFSEEFNLYVFIYALLSLKCYY